MLNDVIYYLFIQVCIHYVNTFLITWLLQTEQVFFKQMNIIILLEITHVLNTLNAMGDIMDHEQFSFGIHGFSNNVTAFCIFWALS